MFQRLFSAVFCVQCMGVICWILLFGAWLAAQQPADVVLHNAKILTVDKNFSTAQAIALQGNRIAAVGSNQDILRMAGPNTKVFDLKGRMVIPGTINSHMHIFDEAEVTYGGMIGYEKMTSYPTDWSAVNSVQDVLNQVQTVMVKYKFQPGEWIYFASKGTGMTAAGEKIMIDGLTRWDLDKVTPNNPVVMGMAWPNVNGILVNSKAIDIIWAKHGDFIKKYGRYWIDPTGRPDGHMENPANRFFLSALPTARPEDIGPVYAAYARERHAMGNTGISTRMPDYAVAAIKWMESRGQWWLRFGYGMEGPFGTTEDLSNLEGIGKQMGTGSDMFWMISSAPSAIDGSGSRACSTQTRVTAVSDVEQWWPNGQCLLDIEYKGAKGAKIQANYVREWLEAGARDGVRLANTHAAADRTVKQTLNVIEEMQKRYGPNAGRGWALDHCRMVDPADLPRAAKLGLMFSCATSLGAPGSGEAGAYGEKIANTFASPVKSMLKAGVIASLESSTGNTWESIETVIARKDRNGKVWGPQERLTRDEALIMATRNAAIYILRGDKLGSLEAGKLADVVVLDQDYMTMPEDKISDMQPQMTMVDGKIVFAHTQFAREYDLSGLGPPSGMVISTLTDLRASRKPSGISRR